MSTLRLYLNGRSGHKEGWRLCIGALQLTRLRTGLFTRYTVSGLLALVLWHLTRMTSSGLDSHEAAPVMHHQQPLLQDRPNQATAPGTTRPPTSRLRAQGRVLVVGSEAHGPASKGNGARLQGSLDCEELVAYLLAVQVLDDIVCQANLLELTEGIALQGEQSLQALQRRCCHCH